MVSRKIHLTLCLLVATVGIADAQTLAPSSATVSERSPQDFRDPACGLTSVDLARRALTANADLAAARLDVERARG
jgi:hypothetical protein